MLLGSDNVVLPPTEIINTEAMKTIRQILAAYRSNDNNYTIEEAEKELLDLFSVSKRFEIDFDGNVLAGIEITNNKPKVFGAMNGWGNGISPDKCKITEKTD